MKFDLCFSLIDLGEPSYKAMSSEMIRSAKRAFKGHDMRIVQLTDNRGVHHPDADGVFAMDTECKPEQLCQFRGYLTAEYALKNQGKVMFCDVDLIWHDDSAARAMEEQPRKIHLIERDWPCMPYNNGLVMTEGHGEFWDRYKKCIASYPLDLSRWWTDQLAMATVVPQYDNEAFVVYNMETWLPAPDQAPTAPLKGFAAHFKGNRKDMMVQYARLFDDGQWIEELKPHQGWKA